mgnify:CR=1 FL=1
MGSVDTETEIKCPKCKKMINRDRAAKNKYVCYECGYYFRVKTHNRIRMVADRKSFQPWFEEIEESNPLKYEGYEEKLSEARGKSGVCMLGAEKQKAWLELNENILMDRDGMELDYYRDLCADYGIRSCCDIEDFNSLLQGLGEDAVRTAELFPDEDESITMGGM